MLTQWILAVLLTLPRFYLDTESDVERAERLRTVAVAIDEASARATCSGAYASDSCQRIWPGSQEELARVLITQGFYESRFAQHVHEDRCRVAEIGECDYGRAKSVWQVQRGHWISREVWTRLGGTSLESTRAAAWVATRAISQARSRCGTLPGAISLYATGTVCSWSGAKKRYLFAQSLSARLNK